MTSFLRHASGKIERAVVWFKNDQRVFDNASLREAEKLCVPILCVYCFDDRHFAISPLGMYVCFLNFLPILVPKSLFDLTVGSKKTGLHRSKFLIESISCLRSSLRGLGSDLLVAYVRPELLLEKILNEKSAVIFESELATEEQRVERAVEKCAKRTGATVIKIPSQSTMYNRFDLPFDSSLRDLPNTFTDFKNSVERSCEVRPMDKPLVQLLHAGRDLPSDVISPVCSFEYLPTDVDLQFPEGAFSLPSSSCIRARTPYDT